MLEPRDELNNRLMAIIAAYWKAQGYKIPELTIETATWKGNVEIKKPGQPPEKLYRNVTEPGIRSNMINGMPR